MGVNATMGLKKIYIQSAKADGSMPANGADWKDLGDVYQDTCTLKDADGTSTVHKSETSSKKITQYEEGDTTVELSLMDPDLEMLAKLFGGEITGTSGSRKWTRPRKLPYQEFAIWQLPEDGLLVGCPNCRIIPKFEITYSAKGICLVPLTIQYQGELTVEEGNTTPNVAAG